jgi:hypothetical protein
MPDEPMSSLFAPPYIPGDPQAAQALAAWNLQNRPVRGGDVEGLRMPNEYEAPQQQIMPMGSNKYGEGRIPPRQNYRESRGQVSPDVLRAAAMGTPFNVEQRRAAIAQRVAQNQQRQAEEAQRQQMLMQFAQGGGYGNPYAAGMQFGQGMGTQMAGAGMPMLPPPRY